MDFLFAKLPDTNFQMTDEQLVLWQRNAIFECDCDNFINRRLELERGTNSTTIESAINAAISHHGLRPRSISTYSDDDDDSSVDGDDAAATPAQRPRLMTPSNRAAEVSPPAVVHISPQASPEAGNYLNSFYQDAITLAIQARGLGIQRNS